MPTTIERAEQEPEWSVAHSKILNRLNTLTYDERASDLVEGDERSFAVANVRYPAAAWEMGIATPYGTLDPYVVTLADPSRRFSRAFSQFAMLPDTARRLVFTVPQRNRLAVPVIDCKFFEDTTKLVRDIEPPTFSCEQFHELAELGGLYEQASTSVKLARATLALLERHVIDFGSAYPYPTNMRDPRTF